MAGLAGLGEVWLGKAGEARLGGICSGQARQGRFETEVGNNRRRKKMKGLDYIGWITASGIAEARHYSGICDNVKILKSALKREKEFKNRKTVIRMLEIGIRKLEKEKKHV